jgi:hypothetical protein
MVGGFVVAANEDGWNRHVVGTGVVEMERLEVLVLVGTRHALQIACATNRFEIAATDEQLDLLFGMCLLDASNACVDHFELAMGATDNCDLHG